MARRQASLFDVDGGTVQPDGVDLLLVRRPDRPLTPAQREFNRLVLKVEQLREHLRKETRRLDTALAFHAEHISPRLKRLSSAQKALLRGLAAFLDSGVSKRKKDRSLLRQIVEEKLEKVFQDLVPGEDDDLLALFERINGVNYETIRREGNEEIRFQMESMFKDFGIEIDLSDLQDGMSEETMAAKFAEAADTMRRKSEEEEWNARESHRRKSKKQHERENRLKQVEEARSKSISSIYKQLARVLHPDLEQDEDLRQKKVVLMQELTSAYRENDLHTLLRLELQWVSQEQGNLDRLTQDKLLIYNQVLRDQVFGLKEEIAFLAYHPRYQSMAAPDGMFDMRLRTDGPAQVLLLDKAIQKTQAVADRLRTAEANTEVQNIIREARLQDRRSFRVEF